MSGRGNNEQEHATRVAVARALVYGEVCWVTYGDRCSIDMAFQPTRAIDSCLRGFAPYITRSRNGCLGSSVLFPSFFFPVSSPRN